jgi:inorganic pyrophosphatase/exopolyphosphatase
MSDVPIIVMGGSAYADIDVLACAAAYKQYLQLHGHCAHALITGPWNQTIPSSIRQWQLDVEKEFPYRGRACKFILVDISDPRYVDSFVDLDAVEEVFDHHYGYENYWKEKIGDRANIEKVGACATLIWEKFKTAKIEDKITSTHANLLYTAVIANTLDFKSTVTHERDRVAAEELRSCISLPADWKERYYTEIEAEFLQNSLKNLLEDTKSITLFNTRFNFGQIELTNAQNFLQNSMSSLEMLDLRVDCENKKEQWIVNIVSIEEGCSYLYSNCLELLELLKRITSARIVDGKNLLATQRLWLRKELLKEMMCFNL